MTRGRSPVQASTTRRFMRCRRPPAAATACVYASSPAFPINSYNATNYWVDVVFTEP
jgi:hypothetical protein